ncbi:MAG: BatA domain-containing protein [Planctomycetes bacterium]|nr:BatA domain-containing protein [Planctomycetota bacterium]
MNLAAPHALWLFPAAVAVLVLLQLYRSRRREVLAGSLMLWRRVAAKEHAPRKRRIVFDRAFALQCAALLCLAAAIAGPALTVGAAPGRHVVLLLDNGPSSRARAHTIKGGAPHASRAWEACRDAANAFLDQLGANDRVKLVASSPAPRVLGEGASPAQARAELERLLPALSGPDAEAAWLFALDTARAFDPGSDARASVLAVSARPAPEAAGGAAWQCVTSDAPRANVALAAFGSAVLPDANGKESAPAEILVQARNFGPAEVSGRVVLEVQGPEGTLEEKDARALKLAAGAAAGAAFRLEAPLPALRLSWRADTGTDNDALPEDDAVTARPREISPPRVRVHGTLPHLEDLFAKALHAKRLALDEAGTADLEVYADGVPDEVPEGARAALFVAPQAGFGAFEVEEGTLKRPRAHPAEADALTAGMPASADGLDVLIEEARVLKAAGDLKALWRDAEGHPLAARFALRDGRPAFVLAFVPGSGPRERLLEGPPLAALLVRMLLEAAGTREPYAVTSAAALERAAGKALPLDWTPSLADGEGVLDAVASALPTGAKDSARLNAVSLPAASAPKQWDLAPWLAALALLLMLAEMFLERSPLSAASPARAQTERPAAEGKGTATA